MYNLILKTKHKRQTENAWDVFVQVPRRTIFRFLHTQLLWHLTLWEAHVMLCEGIESAFDVETFLTMVFIKPFCLFPGLSTKRLKRS